MESSKRGASSTVHVTRNDSMIMSPLRETRVSSALVRTVRVAGAASPVTVPDPSRLRNSRSASLIVALPTYEASHPQGCSAASMRTANGMTRPPFCSKYHARSGTSYSSTTTLPSRIPPCGPSTLYRVAVLLGEERTEQRGDLAGGEVLQFGPVEGRPQPRSLPRPQGLPRLRPRPVADGAAAARVEGPG
ncbi:hypothetical protein ACIBRY_32110 [Streptomyces anulatus]